MKIFLVVCGAFVYILLYFITNVGLSNDLAKNIEKEIIENKKILN